MQYISRTNDSSKIDLAILNADKLINISLHTDSTCLFPYSFNYSFHEVDIMKAPWYSAMAQGKALSVFCRLYELTSDDRYIEIADKIFNSFYRFKYNSDPWISCIDKDGALWLEEYPHEEPSHVLNGMIFAIYGIYDYYILNNSEEAKVMLKASLTTIKNNLENYRQIDDLSYYSLKYDHKIDYYQRIHIQQLHDLSAITDDNYFSDMADLMQEDFNIWIGNNPPKKD